MSVKTPTSSLTAIELLVNQLWYRTIAKIKWFFGWLFCGGIPEAPTTRPCPINRLPQELVEMILSYLIYDTPSLLACSLTCCSWYTAVVPHLHHSLTTDNHLFYPQGSRYLWPKPLRKSYNLGLLPLVKRFRIRLGEDGNKFTPAWLGWRNLRYFSALTNLQELGIDHLQVPAFMPDIQRWFGHFSPTLRFLALKEPKGSCRQILYFIGIFPNLQDLKLNYPLPTDEKESTADATLIPLSVPPLRGCLTLTCFTREKLVKDMIALFGGLRFRRMDLFRVNCVRLLLDACVDTLETLRLYPTEPYANTRALLQDFDLSQNKFLRTLETTAESIDGSESSAASDFFKTILSSVATPGPLDVVIIYQHFNFNYMPHQTWCDSEPVDSEQQGTKERHSKFHQQQLKVFREMHSVRNFRLVLCADVPGSPGDPKRVDMETLECIAKAEGAEEGLDCQYRPLIVFERRLLRTRPSDHNTGWSGKWWVLASAL